MKIVLATGIYPPDIGGPASFVHRLAGELKRRGDEPVVICYGDEKTIQGEGWDVHVVSRAGGAVARYVRYAIEVWKAAKTSQIVFLQGPVSEGFPGTIGALVARKPMVMKVVGDYAWEIYQRTVNQPELLDMFVTHRHSGKIRVLEFLERWTIRRAKKIVTPSHYLKCIVEQWGAPSEKIEVVYNQVELPPVSSTRDKLRSRFHLGTERVLLTVGRAVPWKDVDFLISLLPKLSSNFILVHIGDGPELGRWKSLMQTLGLESRVRFLGKQNQQTVAEWYRAADLFVLPSSYEGFSHVAVEALSSGLPCIVSDKGGNVELPQLVDAGVSVVPYRDEMMWMNEIQRAIHSHVVLKQALESSMIDSFYSILHAYAATI
ncbi:glycosyltransferase family 4 protein [Patescibacteria group bacterium]|nr:glycosyltransferase family 4 protein [Patescibacteria group bacterium]